MIEFFLDKLTSICIKYIQRKIQMTFIYIAKHGRSQDFFQGGSLKYNFVYNVLKYKFDVCKIKVFKELI